MPNLYLAGKDVGVIEKQTRIGAGRWLIVAGGKRHVCEPGKYEIRDAADFPVFDSIAAAVIYAIENNVALSHTSLFKTADRHFCGTTAQGKYTAHQAHDVAETALALCALGKIDGGECGVAELLARMAVAKRMSALMATHTRMDAEAVKLQQFSTPLALGMLMAWIANMGDAPCNVLEPSCGTGMLAAMCRLMSGGQALVHGVEVDQTRFRLVNKSGLLAATYHIKAENLGVVKLPPIDRVVMNPPFSEAEEHIRQALRRLAPGGRLVALCPDGMSRGKQRGDKFIRELYREHTVRATINVAGKEYNKQGTTYPQVLWVVDKVKIPGYSQPPLSGQVWRYEDLPEMLLPVRELLRPQDSLSGNTGLQVCEKTVNLSTQKQKPAVKPAVAGDVFTPYKAVALGGMDAENLVEATSMAVVPKPELVGDELNGLKAVRPGD